MRISDWSSDVCSSDLDGFDALAKMGDHKPSLIFCDILMPRLDGYQTCALIKKSAKFHSTPVIMLSSKDGLFDRARGAMVGRSEERRVGKECVSTCRSRWSPDH